jgi:hypothetical protein
MADASDEFFAEIGHLVPSPFEAAQKIKKSSSLI